MSIKLKSSLSENLIQLHGLTTGAAAASSGTGMCVSGSVHLTDES